MGRGKALTPVEKGKIIAYKECNLTYRQIAEKIGKSKNVICNFLKNPANYGNNMKGRTKKVRAIVFEMKMASFTGKKLNFSFFN